MSRKIAGSLLAILFIVIVVAPNILGGIAEKNFRAAAENPALADFFSVEVLSYERGWFSSEVEVSLSPAGFLKTYLETISDTIAAQRALIAGQNGTEGDDQVALPENPLLAIFPYQEKVTLLHGPYFLTGGPGVGMARLYERIDFVEFIKQKFASLDGDSADQPSTPPDIELTSGSATIGSMITVGFDGRISTAGEIPGGTLRLNNDNNVVQVEWAGGSSAMQIDLATGTIEAASAYGPITANVEGKGGSIGNFAMAPIAIDIQGEFRSIFSFIGETEFTWGGFAWHGEDGQVIRFSDLSSISSVVENAENPALTDGTSGLQFSEFAIEGEAQNFSVGPVQMEMTYRNFDMTAYGEMARTMMAFQPAPGKPGEIDPEAKAKLMEHANRFLEAGPVMEMPRLTVVSSQGNVEMDFLLQAAPGTTITENPADYIGNLRAEVSFAIDEDMVRSYLVVMSAAQAAALHPDSQVDAAQLEAATDQVLAGYANAGMLEKKDGRLLSDILFEDGKVYVRGQLVMDLMQQQIF